MRSCRASQVCVVERAGVHASPACAIMWASSARDSVKCGDRRSLRRCKGIRLQEMVSPRVDVPIQLSAPPQPFSAALAAAFAGGPASLRPPGKQPVSSSGSSLWVLRALLTPCAGGAALRHMSEQAERYKSQGNAALQAGQYPEAIELYSKAIALEPSNHVYFSNRAATYAALKRWREALDDSHEVVTLKPDWVKGWVRRGAAFTGLGKHEEARKAYLKATQLEPSNGQIQEYLRAAERAVKEEKDKKWEDDLWSDDDDEGGAGAAAKRTRGDGANAAGSA